MTTLLIGGYSGDKGAGTGITVLDGDPASGHHVTATIRADSASWITRHPELPVLYAVEETADGHVQAWSLAEGSPGEPLGRSATGGAEPAHLTVDSSGRFLITANYSGGSISVHELGPDGSIGRRTDLVRHERHGEHDRQEQAHPHMVRDIGGMLLVTDLGGDAIYQYRLGPDGKLVPEGVVAAPPGSGPRHVLPVGDHYYVTAELSGQVLGYDAEGQLLSAVPASKAEGPNQPSELASNGRYLYVANRGPDTVSVFALDGTSRSHAFPRYVTEVQVGAWPRHIALDDDLLYVANERSHEVMVLRIDPATGVPAHVQTIEVPSPTVVLP
jgi:6-phosphogluconolactonase